MTSSPGPTSRACNAITSASVPLATPTHGRPAIRAEISDSSARTRGPRMNWPASSTSATAASICSRSGPYWALMSMRGMAIWGGTLPSGPAPRGSLPEAVAGGRPGVDVVGRVVLARRRHRRHPHAHGGAESLAALGLRRAPEALRDVLDDRQAEPGAAEPLRAG